MIKTLVDKDKLRKENWHGHNAWRRLLQRPTIDMEWWKLDSENLAKFLEAHPVLRQLSPDVKEFIQKGSHNLTKLQVGRILRSPSKYFSIARNVPLSMRKQVYL
jgi:hypothetical protein